MNYHPAKVSGDIMPFVRTKLRSEVRKPTIAAASTRTTWIGVDPGANGGLACIDSLTNRISAINMPDTMPDILQWIRLHILPPEIIGVGEIIVGKTYDTETYSVKCYAMMEEVGGYIAETGEGKTKHGGEQPGSRMFNFGASYGSLEMALIACGLVKGSTYWLVRPQKWQGYMGVVPRRKGEEHRVFKNRLKELAKKTITNLEPRTKITNATADAILLAAYCQRLYRQ